MTTAMQCPIGYEASTMWRRTLGRSLIVCAILCSAGVARVQAQNLQVPFNGRQQGQFSFMLFTVTAGTKTVQITAAGPVTGLGFSKTVIRGDVDLAADLKPTPRPPGTWTLTAANGDMLEGAFIWRGTPTGTFESSLSRAPTR